MINCRSCAEGIQSFKGVHVKDGRLWVCEMHEADGCKGLDELWGILWDALVSPESSADARGLASEFIKYLLINKK